MLMPIERINFLGVGFDRLGSDQVLALLAAVRPGQPYGYVVTPNVDHVVRLAEPDMGDALAPIYLGADLSLCDSRIIRHLGRFHGLELPLVPGSDLTRAIFEHIIRPCDRIAIVGGTPSVVEKLGRKYPGVEFIHHMPPMGLRDDIAARTKTAAFVASANSRFIFLAVGSPQQEMIAAAVREFPQATGMALCIGASLEFITGHQRRAPRLLQLLSLEWAHRLASDPRRLWRRYLVQGPRVFLLAARHRRNHPCA